MKKKAIMLLVLIFFIFGNVSSESLEGENRNEISLVAVQSELYGVLLKDYEVGRPFLRKYAGLDLRVVEDMDYNPLKDMVFFADPKNELISAVNLSEGKVYRLIEKIKQPISVAIDWLRDNLYWINGFHHTVEVARSAGYFKLTVVKHLENPTDLALDVVDGYLFVIDSGVTPSVVKCELNGMNCETIVHDDIIKPSSLSIDRTTEPKKLYWTDSQKNTIESVDLFGGDRNIVFKDLKHPKVVYVGEENILWSEKRSKHLNVASKSSLDYVKKINIELEKLPAGEWFMTLTMVGSKVNVSKDPCLSNGKCTQLCFSKTEERMTCSCAQGLVLEADGSTCIVTKCDFNQRKCEDGECIPSIYWCDGSVDCDDGSDEKDCTYFRKCTEEEFQCKNGHCINLVYKCDGTHDCLDDSDEDPLFCKTENCTHAENWRCESGQCIILPWRCDGKPQCEDGSDEEECPTFLCRSDEISCGGWCIPNTWWCDGWKDCENGEDEKECPCKLGEYKCKSGSCFDKTKLCNGELSCGGEQLNLTCAPDSVYIQNLYKEICPANFIPCNTILGESQCIPFQAWCNGTSECSNEHDEKHCPKICSGGKVKCRGEDICILTSWVCDGSNDCSDGSDEHHCLPPKPRVTIPKPTCPSDEFECPDGVCVPYSKICDGFADCINEDEHEDCGKCAQDKGGCEQICHSDLVKATCSCEKGYKLSSDGTACNDIDECEDESVCHHFCINKRGTFACACEEKYSLMDDGFTCKPTNGEHSSVAMISKRRIVYLNEELKRVNNTELIPPYLKIETLIYDPSDEKLLGIDGKNGVLYKRGTFGNWTKELSNIGNITATSLDYINRNIYFAKAAIIYKSKRSAENKFAISTVKVYNLESNYFGYLFTVPGRRISAMEISFLFREMITCENDDTEGSLVSRNMHGFNPRILADYKILMCQSLAIDEIKKRVYWLDGLLNRIESVDFLGYDRKRFSAKIYKANGLGLIDRNLMWVNLERRTLVKCSIKTPSECFEVYGGSDVSFVNIKPIYDMSLRTPCPNSICPHICVPHSLDVPHCLCADGFSSENGGCNSLTDVQNDEALVNCVKNPCINGLCEQNSSGYILCRCSDGYRGKYCEIPTKTTESEAKKVFLIVVLILIGLFVLGILYFNQKKNGNVWNRGRALPHSASQKITTI